MSTTGQPAQNMCPSKRTGTAKGGIVCETLAQDNSSECRSAATTGAAGTPTGRAGRTRQRMLVSRRTDVAAGASGT